VYKILEQDQKNWEAQVSDIFERMKTYQKLFRKEIVMDDILKLVEKPVRKISKFDTKAIDEEILAIEAEMEKIRDNLDHITRYTVDWFKALKKKYGKDFPRQTELTGFETIAVTKVVNNNAKLFANKTEGFVGIGLKKEDGVEFIADCSDLSEIVVINKEGKYRISKVTDKAFFWKDIIYVGVFNRNDTRTIYNVIYKEGGTEVTYAKRFAITGITRDKDYDITSGVPGSKLLWFSANTNGEAETVKIYYRQRPKLKKLTGEYDFSTLAIKGKTSRGNLVSKNPVQRIMLKSKGVSTISGKDVWYDSDIQKLNDDGRGLYLGQFDTQDKVLAVFRNGTFYTTSFDVSNRYQGDVLRIEKFDPDKTFTVLYFDGDPNVRAFYVKRFSFTLSDNMPMSFISDGPKSYLVDISEELHPQFMVTYGGRNEGKSPDVVDAEAFIAKKGLSAKGKRCVDRGDVSKVEFVEPLHKPEDDIKEPDEPEMAEIDVEDIADVSVDAFLTDIPKIEEPTLF